LEPVGNLVIKTFKDGDKYVDGCITTQGKFEHAFGYSWPSSVSRSNRATGRPSE